MPWPLILLSGFIPWQAHCGARIERAGTAWGYC